MLLSGNMGNPSDAKIRYEHPLIDFIPYRSTEANYRHIDSPLDTHRPAMRRTFNGHDILNSWRTRDEVPKIALHQGRKFAVIHAFAVLLPLAGAILLIIINARTTSLVYVSPSTIAGLQFLAKFLDILMQVSLAKLALHTVRRQLLGPDSLPLGALLALFRVMDTSYLWSLDMWGAITSPALQGSYRVFFCIMIPFIVLLASVIGPSSAILVIPRQIQYLSHQELALFNESSTMFPTTVRLNSDGSLPAEAQLRVLYDGILTFAKAGGYDGGVAKSAPIQDASGTRLLNFAVINDRGLQATIPTRLTGSFITTRRFERVTDFAETSAKQPWSAIDCNALTIERQEEIGGKFIDFGPNKTALNTLIPWSNMFPATISTDNTTFVTATYPQEMQCDAGGQVYPYNFTTLVQKTPDNSSRMYSTLFVFASINQPCQSNASDAWASGLACTVSTAWEEYQVNATANDRVAESYALSESSGANISIQVPPDFLMRIVTLYMEEVNDTNVVIYIPPLLSVALSDSLPSLGQLQQQQSSVLFDSSSNPAPSDDFTQQQIDLARSWINDKKALSRYSTVEIFGLNWTDISSLVQSEFKVYRAEYGYDSQSIPVKLALVVLVLYVLIVGSYLVYTLVKGELGTSWDSVADLLMLALNSRNSPPEMGPTSVGADSIATFREPVNVRINEQGTAELIFEKDHSVDQASWMRVRTNVAY